MIRFLIVCLTVIGFLVLAIPVALVEWVIGKFNLDLKSRSSLNIVKGVFSLILWETGVQITVLGEENVPKDTPVLYVANHRSFFDILVTYVRVPRPTGYIAKKEMEKIPLLSTWMRYLHCLFMDRSDIKKGLQTILDGVEKLKNGVSICIFPEGTRSKNGNVMGEWHGGSFKCAVKAKADILPFCVIDTYKVLDQKGSGKMSCQLHYLKPIPYEEYAGMKTTEIAAMVKARIQACIDQNT